MRIRVLHVASGNHIQDGTPIVINQIRSLSEMGILCETFLIKKKGILGYLTSAVEIHKIVAKKNFDILHAHYGLCGITTKLAMTGKPVVVSFMGSDLIWDSTQIGNRLKNNFILGFYKIFVKKFVAFSIVKSKNLLYKLNNAKQLEVIPNGVDCTKFSPMDKINSKKKLNLSLKTRYIVFASNPDRAEKNYHLALKAVGSLNIDNIFLLPLSGFSNELMPLYYSAAECLILTSFHEGSPNVIKEAMACNCPIVSTNVGDIEWVLGGIEGCFISSFETNEFAANIKKALDYSSSKGRTKGLTRILELGLDSKTIAERIIEIYKKVMRIDEVEDMSKGASY